MNNDHSAAINSKEQFILLIKRNHKMMWNTVIMTFIISLSVNVLMHIRII